MKFEFWRPPLKSAIGKFKCSGVCDVIVSTHAGCAT
jgi:hypothetical protein